MPLLWLFGPGKFEQPPFAPMIIADSCILVCDLLHLGAWANAALLTFLLTACHVNNANTHSHAAININNNSL